MSASYKLAPGKCLFCFNDERPVVISESDDLTSKGICEICSVRLYLWWKDQKYTSQAVLDQLSGKKGYGLKILVPRLQADADPNHPDSYDYATIGQGELPSAKLIFGTNEAVTKILNELGMETWPSHLEYLYSGHTWRGGVAKLMVVTAWTVVAGLEVENPSVIWRTWPPWGTDTLEVGFYSALESMWPTWLKQHETPIGIQVSEMAARYIRMQQSLRSQTLGSQTLGSQTFGNLRTGKSRIDTSMAKILREGMTDNEKIIDQLIKEHENRQLDLHSDVLKGLREPAARVADPRVEDSREPAAWVADPREPAARVADPREPAARVADPREPAAWVEDPRVADSQAESTPENQVADDPSADSLRSGDRVAGPLRSIPAGLETPDDYGENDSGVEDPGDEVEFD